VFLTIYTYVPITCSCCSTSGSCR